MAASPQSLTEAAQFAASSLSRETAICVPGGGAVVEVSVTQVWMSSPLLWVSCMWLSGNRGHLCRLEVV